MLNTYQCLDGYRTKKATTTEGDMSRMIDLLLEVHDILCGPTEQEGIISITPMLDRTTTNKRKRNISGSIVSDAGHFTCYSLCHQQAILIDIFSLDALQFKKIEDLVRTAYRPKTLVSCEANLGEEFVQQLFVRSRSHLELAQATQLVAQISRLIGMRQCKGCLENVYAGGYDLVQGGVVSHVAVHQTTEMLYLDIFASRKFSEQQVLTDLAVYLPNFTSRTVSRGTRLGSHGQLFI